MCFSPQRRAMLRHPTCEKCSEDYSFLTFSLPNVLFATAACNFWFLLWPHDSAPAALTGLLLDWPDTRIIEKTQHFATSLTFGVDVSSFFWRSRYCIFFLPTWLPVSSAFQLSILSEVCYLNFLRQYMHIFIYHISPGSSGFNSSTRKGSKKNIYIIYIHFLFWESKLVNTGILNQDPSDLRGCQ